jgi:aminopeptidase N
VLTPCSSNGSLITQCEAEGFRNITYFIDRPDVMASFTTTLVGDAQQFPVMLANGDLLESNVMNGHRYSVFHCPHRIPAYLFALVAGNFARVSDEHTRPDGRAVSLNIYVPHGCESKTRVAMRALKDCMVFDELEYGRICDVNQVRADLVLRSRPPAVHACFLQYNIVATPDFTMGAMENKGLNIFNSKYVLCDEATATDSAMQGVSRVVAHECALPFPCRHSASSTFDSRVRYLHNWTGNRVTVRDWFQLCLKEGLTVFR